MQAQGQALHVFVADEEFENLRTQSTALREEEERKAAVPDMVPGYRVSPLTHGKHPFISVWSFSCASRAMVSASVGFGWKRSAI